MENTSFVHFAYIYIYICVCVCTYITASKYDNSIYLSLIFTSQIVLHFFKYLGTLLLDLVLARSICCHFYVHFTGVSWVSVHGDIYFHHTLDGTHKSHPHHLTVRFIHNRLNGYSCLQIYQLKIGY